MFKIHTLWNILASKYFFTKIKKQKKSKTVKSKITN